MTENTTEAPTLPPGFDPDEWRERLNAAGNRYLLAVAAYEALPKDHHAILAALPPGATAQEAQVRLQAASSALDAGLREVLNAESAASTVFGELFAGFPKQYEAAMLTSRQHGFTAAASRARSEALEQERRAAETEAVRRKHDAADALEAKKREYETAMREARSAGVPV